MKSLFPILLLVCISLSICAQDKNASQLSWLDDPILWEFLDPEIINELKTFGSPQESQFSFSLLDSSYGYKWSQSLSAWELKNRRIPVFDNKLNLIESTSENYDGVSWSFSSKNTHTFDSNNELVNSSYYQFSGNNWVSTFQITLTYDANQDVVGVLVQDWNGNEWVNNYKGTLTHDNNHNQLTNLAEVWVNNQWTYASRGFFEYDNEDRLVYTLSQGWNNDWVDQSRYIKSYNTNGLLFEDINQSWSGTEWKNSQKNSNFYDDHNDIILELTENSPDGNTWVNQSRNIIQYDDLHRRIRKTYERFNNDTWENNLDAITGWDDNDNNVSTVFILWQFDSEWIRTDSSWSYYSQVTDTHSTKKNYLDVSIYPNPAKDLISVGVPDIGLESNYLYKIISFSGQVVLTGEINFGNSKDIIVSSLLPGSYELLIEGKKEYFRQTFLKQ